MEFNMCNPLQLYIWTNILYYTTCYEQLVFTNITEVNSSSTYTTENYVGSANKTIDKNFTQSYTGCMHTDEGKEKAWLQLDLGDIYNLKSVKIWYRNDRGENLNTKRLQGFLVLTTHNSDTSLDDSNLCYEDPKNGTLDTIIEVECTQTARYVTIYKEDNNEAILEICEVEIYGCPQQRYGENCVPCDTCRFDCDITGQCDRFGCVNQTGYLRPYCKECLPGKYGTDCKDKCGHCTNNETCHHVSGSCPGLCDPGYNGDKCLTPCSSETYGNDCKEKCGHCANNKTCNHINGSCPGLCEAGYQGTKCLTECKSRRYGKNCKEECGHCKSNETCHHINGSCPGFCEPGYHGEKCLTACTSGRYGDDCKEKCGHCASNETCHHINGSCPGSCEEGYYGKKCLKQRNVILEKGKDQLVRSGYTRASSSSVGYGGYAGKTVDGDMKQNIYTYCMYTAAGHTEAWLRIDLRKIYNINSVKFWYRNDKPGVNTKRIEGFSIRISNTTQPVPQNICYQDDEKTTLPSIIEKECEGVAQYVWIYTNKKLSDGVFLEICEVQVFGCSYQDSYGNCISCDQCKNDCNIHGECDEQGCKKDGYRPPYCKECKSERYGNDCSSSCGHCANNSTCNNVTGSCPNKKCALGWKYTKDWKCDQECNAGTFGNNCSSSCSRYCAKGTFCRKSDGRCLSGCVKGWEGFNCSQRCSRGHYGEKCQQKCGKCEDNKTCHHINGSCYGLCKSGFQGEKCKNRCSRGHYGEKCQQKCGKCEDNNTCHHINGSCYGLCEPGYQGEKCQNKCRKGLYGMNCSLSCGRCFKQEHCNHVSGFCPSGLCEPGWKLTSDRKCNQTCNEGFYGMNCTHPCGQCANNATCDHMRGSCPNGYCEPGWKHTTEKKCDKVCDNGTFGLYCRYNCNGHCSGGSPCSKVDGLCLRGCDDGWRNSYCNETCEKGFYGRNCTIPCGQCAKYATCHHVTGSCPNGYCEPGWQNTPHKRCNKECDNGTFGHHCMNNCSGHCKRGLPCKKDDGNCIEGCADGWTNKKCNETCSRGFYGKGCQEICGKCGGTDTCHHVSGSCPRFCAPGYKTEKCDIECDNGTFGFRCNFTCAESCLSICNKINGTCDNCQYGFVGEFCNITVAEAQVQDLTPAAAGAGVFLLILIIAIIVLVVVLARKSRKKKADAIELPERKDLSNNDSQENNPEDKGNKTENGLHREENADIEYIATDNSQKKTLIKISDLGKIIKAFSLEENKKFTEEFKGIPYGEQQHISCAVAKLQQNMPRNRYKTTFPYDHSRVVLKSCPENDYINANYIKDVEGKQRYIATQGPRKNTVQDFWAMIWQENIRVIVMVTKLTEGSTIKCEQYWPAQGDQMTPGQFCLQLMSQKDYANYTQRDINITNKKTKAVKTVNQVQFTAWPDHGTPSPIELLVFYRHVMRLMQLFPDRLLVVHCSAGIGRTGTFIALDALYRQGLKEGKIDVVEYVKIMREDRMNMIQNAGQYVFLYKALYEIFKTNGRLLEKEQFIQEVTSQLLSDKAANASQFKKEFNELISIRPVLDEKDTNDARQNIDLNMTKTVLPADSIRVLLTSYVRGRSNYYNAVPISSYTLRDGLIAAQYPVEGAAIDLVRLLIDQECTILVSINQLSDIATSAEWLSTSAEKSLIAPYKTMLNTGRSLSNRLKMTFLKMKHDKVSEWHTVKVLEILNWKVNEKLPAETDVFVELMNKIQEIIKDPETKITVLSRDGATGCGIFCAVYNAIQQLQQDNEVDMFTIVRQLQMRRPEMISSMSEYQYCCKVVANFFTAHKDDIYENAQGQQGVTKTEENIYANTNS